MNKIYKVIYNKNKHRYEVVSELAKSHGGKCKTTVATAGDTNWLRRLWMRVRGGVDKSDEDGNPVTMSISRAAMVALMCISVWSAAAVSSSWVEAASVEGEPVSVKYDEATGTIKIIKTDPDTSDETILATYAVGGNISPITSIGTKNPTGIIAIGDQSKAVQSNTIAIGADAHAGDVGGSDDTNGRIAIGTKTVASGLRSIALGNYSTTNKGSYNIVQGSDSIGIGTSTSIFGYSGVSIGRRNIIGIPEPDLVKDGVLTTKSRTKYSEGGLGGNSVIVGAYNVAYGNRSNVIGTYSRAMGSNSVAIGSGVQSLSDGAIAIGKGSGYEFEDGSRHKRRGETEYYGRDWELPPEYKVLKQVLSTDIAGDKQYEGTGKGVRYENGGILPKYNNYGAGSSDPGGFIVEGKNALGIGTYTQVRGDSAIGLATGEMTADLSDKDKSAYAKDMRKIMDMEETLYDAKAALTAGATTNDPAALQQAVKTAEESLAAAKKAFRETYLTKYSFVDGDGALGVGRQILAQGDRSMAVGDFAKAISSDAIAYGGQTLANGTNSMAIGGKAHVGTTDTSFDNSMAIGSHTDVQAGNAVALGAFSKVTGQNSLALGFGKQTDSAITYNSVSGKDSTLIGSYGNIAGNNSILIGSSGSIANDRVVGLGNNINIEAADPNDQENNTAGSVFLGDHAGYVKDSKRSRSLGQVDVVGSAGKMELTESLSSTKGALRDYTKDFIYIYMLERQDDGTKIGAPIAVRSDFAGGDSTVGVVSVGSTYQQQFNSLEDIKDYHSKVGSLITVPVDVTVQVTKNGVPLGEQQQTRYFAADSTRDTIYADNTLSEEDKAKVWDTIQKSISSSNSTYTVFETRRIQNVAPGLIGLNSTDAINGSQLFATNQMLGNLVGSLKKTLGDNVTVTEDGEITVAGDIKTLGWIAKADTVVGSNGKVTYDADKKTDETDEDYQARIAELKKDGYIVDASKVMTFKAGKNIELVQKPGEFSISTIDTPSFKSVELRGETKDVDGNKVTPVTMLDSNGMQVYTETVTPDGADPTTTKKVSTTVNNEGVTTDGTVKVTNGKDGDDAKDLVTIGKEVNSDAAPGTDGENGTIGLNGKNGSEAVITIDRGTKSLTNDKNIALDPTKPVGETNPMSMDRITYTTKGADGSTINHEVATLDDGFFLTTSKDVTDKNAPAGVKLNHTIKFTDGANTKVSAVTSTQDGTHELHIDVSGLPVSYTDTDGDAVTKIGDKYYKSNQVVDGKPIDGAAEVPADQVTNNIKLVNTDGTTNTTGTISNVASGIGGKVVDPDHNDSNTFLENVNKVGATTDGISENTVVNAKDLKNVVDTGFKLNTSGQGTNPADTVKIGDTINIIDGANTKVSAIDDRTTGTHTFHIDVTGMPISYTDNQGNALTKIGDNYYKNTDIEDGKPKDNAVAVPADKVTNNVKVVNKDGGTTEQGSIGNVKSVFDSTIGNGGDTGSQIDGINDANKVEKVPGTNQFIKDLTTLKGDTPADKEKLNSVSTVGDLQKVALTPLFFEGDTADGKIGTDGKPHTNTFGRKLSETAKIIGGQTDVTKLTDGNIGVVSNGSDTLTIRLAKELTDLTSVTAGSGDNTTTMTAGGTTTTSKVDDIVKTISTTPNGMTTTEQKVDTTGTPTGESKTTMVTPDGVTVTTGTTDGQTTKTALDKDGLATDGKVVVTNGKDGDAGKKLVTIDKVVDANAPAGTDGEHGQIGLDGKNGSEATITIDRGTKSLADGKNIALDPTKPVGETNPMSMDRITYTTKGANGSTINHEVATLDDGFFLTTSKDVTDDKAAAKVKLNNTIKFTDGANTKVSTVDSEEGIHELHIDVSGLPVSYTDNDGDAVTKIGDKYYKSNQVVDGKPIDGATEVPADQVTNNIKLVNTDGTTRTTGTISNVASGIGGKVVDPDHNDSNTFLENVNKIGVPTNGISENTVVNAKDLKNVVDTGFKLNTSGQGTNPADTVKIGDTINIIDGANTKVSAIDDSTTTGTHTFHIDVTGMPISYTDNQGNALTKIGDNYYKNTDIEDGKPKDNAVAVPADKVTNNVKVVNKDGGTTKQGSIGNVKSVFDSTIGNGGDTGSQIDDINDANKVEKVPGTNQFIKDLTTLKGDTPADKEKLNSVSTVGDLQKVALTPLFFEGDTADGKTGTDGKPHKNTFGRKLSETAKIIGGQTDVTKLTDGNIGVVSNGSDTLTIKLAKELTDLTSVTTGSGDNTTTMTAGGTTTTSKMDDIVKTISTTPNGVTVTTGTTEGQTTKTVLDKDGLATDGKVVVTNGKDGGKELVTIDKVVDANAPAGTDGEHGQIGLDGKNGSEATITIDRGTKSLADGKNIVLDPTKPVGENNPMSMDRITYATKGADGSSINHEVATMDDGFLLTTSGDVSAAQSPTKVAMNHTITIVDGANTKVSKVTTDSTGAIHELHIDVNGLPTTYVDGDGKPITKVGDSYVDADGETLVKVGDAYYRKSQLNNPDDPAAGVKPDEQDKGVTFDVKLVSPDGITNAPKLNNVGSSLVKGDGTRITMGDLNDSATYPATNPIWNSAVNVGDLKAASDAAKTEVTGTGAAEVTKKTAKDGHDIYNVHVDKLMEAKSTEPGKTIVRGSDNKYYYVDNALKQANDGKWYPADQVGTDGKPADGAVGKDTTELTVVLEDKLKNSLVNPNGNGPTVLDNVKSGIGGAVKDADKQDANTFLENVNKIGKKDGDQPAADAISENIVVNAKDLKNLVDTGFKLNTSGHNGDAQTVKIGETIKVVDGANTKVSDITSKDGVHEFHIDVTGLPMTYTVSQKGDAGTSESVSKVGDTYQLADGTKLVKVGDKFYKPSQLVDPKADQPQVIPEEVDKDWIVNDSISLVNKEGSKNAPTLKNVGSGLKDANGNDTTLDKAVGSNAVNVDDLRTMGKAATTEVTGTGAAEVTKKTAKDGHDIYNVHVDKLLTVKPVTPGTLMERGADGKYYAPSEIQDKTFVSDGNGGGSWYAKDDVDKYGTPLDGKSPLAEQPTAMDPNTLKTSVTNPNGDGPTIVDNVKSVLDGSNQFIKDLTGLDPDTDANKLNSVSTVSDLQKVALTPLFFEGDTAESDTTNNAFGRKLSEKAKIVGGQKDVTKLTDNNIGVVSNGSDTLTVKLAKELQDLTSLTTIDETDGTKTIVSGKGVTTDGKVVVNNGKTGDEAKEFVTIDKGTDGSGTDKEYGKIGLDGKNGSEAVITIDRGTKSITDEANVGKDPNQPVSGTNKSANMDRITYTTKGANGDINHEVATLDDGFMLTTSTDVANSKAPANVKLNNTIKFTDGANTKVSTVDSKDGVHELHIDVTGLPMTYTATKTDAQGNVVGDPVSVSKVGDTYQDAAGNKLIKVGDKYYRPDQLVDSNVPNPEVKDAEKANGLTITDSISLVNNNGKTIPTTLKNVGSGLKDANGNDTTLDKAVGSNAVNVDDLRTMGKAATTEVTGTGAAEVTKKTAKDGHDIYNVHVDKLLTVKPMTPGTPMERGADGKYYAPSEIQDKTFVSDGNGGGSWYAKDDVDKYGTPLDGKSPLAEQPTALDKNTLKTSVTNPNGDGPTIVDNVKSVFDGSGIGNGADMSSKIDTIKNGKPVDTAGSNQFIKDLTGLNPTTDANKLNSVSTVSDLQKVALTPLFFEGDTAESATTKNAFGRKLSEKAKIVGGQKDVTKLTDNNIGVVSNGSDTLTVKLAKELQDLTSLTTVDETDGTKTIVSGKGVTTDGKVVVNNGKNGDKAKELVTIDKGTDGSGTDKEYGKIGLDGKNGSNATITIDRGTKSITDEANVGKDPNQPVSGTNKSANMDRITYTTKGANGDINHEVATLDDGFMLTTSTDVANSKAPANVKLNNTIKFTDGANTKVSTVDSKDGVHELHIDVTGLPVTYTATKTDAQGNVVGDPVSVSKVGDTYQDAAGNKLIKVGDKYYRPDQLVDSNVPNPEVKDAEKANGLTITDSISLVNNNGKTIPTTLKNVGSGLKDAAGNATSIDQAVGTNAVNVDDLRTMGKAATTEVTGSGAAEVTKVTGEDGQNIYNVHVDKLMTVKPVDANTNIARGGDGKYYNADDIAGKTFVPSENKWYNTADVDENTGKPLKGKTPLDEQPTAVDQNTLKNSLVNPNGNGPTVLDNVKSGIGGEVKDAAGNNTFIDNINKMVKKSDDGTVAPGAISEDTVVNAGDLKNLVDTGFKLNTSGHSGDAQTVKIGDTIKVVDGANTRVSDITSKDGVHTFHIDVTGLPVTYTATKTDANGTPTGEPVDVSKVGDGYQLADGTKLEKAGDKYYTPDQLENGQPKPDEEGLTIKESVSLTQDNSAPATLERVGSGRRNGMKANAAPMAWDKILNPSTADDKAKVDNMLTNAANIGDVRDAIKSITDGTSDNASGGFGLTGNNGDVKQDLGKTITVKGGIANKVDEAGQDLHVPEKSTTDQNTYVNVKDVPNADGNGTHKEMVVEIAKDLTDLDSVTVGSVDENGNGGTVINKDGMTVKDATGNNSTSIGTGTIGTSKTDKDGNTSSTNIDGGTITSEKKDKDGNKQSTTIDGSHMTLENKDKDGKLTGPKTEVSNEGMTITPVDKDGNAVTDPKKQVSITDKGLNNGGNQIINVDSGLKDTNGSVKLKDATGDMLNNAVNVGDLKEAINNAQTAVDGDGAAEISKSVDDNGRPTYKVHVDKLVEAKADDGKAIVRGEDNKFYYKDESLQQGTDGKWYAPDQLNPDNTPVEGAVGKATTELTVVPQDKLKTSLVNPNGDGATKLDNIKSAIGGEVKDANGNNTFIDNLNNVGKIGADGKPIIGEDAAVTTGDLKNLADTPLYFSGDRAENATGQNKFDRKLSEETKIVGGAKGELSDNNIGVISNGKDTLTVKLSKDLKDLNTIEVNDSVSVGKDGDSTVIKGSETTSSFTEVATGPDGQPLYEVDKNGEVVRDANGDPIPVTKTSSTTTKGGTVTIKDSNVATGPDGKPLYKVDENGNPVLDEKGHKIPITESSSTTTGGGKLATDVEKVKMVDGKPVTSHETTTIDGSHFESKDKDGNYTTINGGEIKSYDKDTNGSVTIKGDSLTASSKDENGHDKVTNISSDGFNSTATTFERDGNGQLVLDPDTGLPKEVTNKTNINSDGFTATRTDSEGNEVLKTTMQNGNIAIEKPQPIINPTTGEAYKVLDKNGNWVPAHSYTKISDNGFEIQGINQSGTGISKVRLSSEGLDNGGNRITHVAEGIAPDDAVNVSQLRDLTQNINNDIANVGANAAALAGLKAIQYDPLEPTQIMAAVGTYRGKQAAALGIAHYKNEDTMFHMGVSIGSDHTMANVGVTYKFGRTDEKKAVPDRYKAGPISSTYVLQDEMVALKEENARMRANDEKMNAAYDEILDLVKQLKQDNEEMKKKLEKLEKK